MPVTIQITNTALHSPRQTWTVQTSWKWLWIWHLLYVIWAGWWDLEGWGPGLQGSNMRQIKKKPCNGRCMTQIIYHARKHSSTVLSARYNTSLATLERLVQYESIKKTTVYMCRRMNGARRYITRQSSRRVGKELHTGDDTCNHSETSRDVMMKLRPTKVCEIMLLTLWAGRADDAVRYSMVFTQHTPQDNEVKWLRHMSCVCTYLRFLACYPLTEVPPYHASPSMYGSESSAMGHEPPACMCLNLCFKMQFVLSLYSYMLAFSYAWCKDAANHMHMKQHYLPIRQKLLVPQV